MPAETVQRSSLPLVWTLLLAEFACIQVCQAARPLWSLDEHERTSLPIQTLGSPQHGSGVPVKAPVRRSSPSVRYEIRYVCPQAEEVHLLWALNNWQIPERKCWPSDSTPLKGYPYCKMRRYGDTFTIALALPEGATLDYCFHVLSPARRFDIWDTNGAPHRDYHSRVVGEGLAIVISEERPPPVQAAAAPKRGRSIVVYVTLPAIVILTTVLLIRFLLLPRRYRPDRMS